MKGCAYIICIDYITLYKGLHIHRFWYEGGLRTNTLHMCTCMLEVTSIMSNSFQPSGVQRPRLLCPWDSLGKNTWVVWHFFLQGIFLTQGSNSSLFHLLHWQAGSLPLAPSRKPNTLHILRDNCNLKTWRYDKRGYSKRREQFGCTKASSPSAASGSSSTLYWIFLFQIMQSSLFYAGNLQDKHHCNCFVNGDIEFPRG